MPNDKKSNSLLTDKPFWVYALAILGISAWMFFLGVLVGRGTAPIKFDIDKFQKILLKKRLDAEQKEMSPAYREEQKISETDDSEKFKPLQPPPGDEDVPTGPPGSDNPDTKTDSQPGQKSKPAVVTATGRLYTVQVASLRSRDSAERIVKKLSQKGYEAFVTRSSSSEAGTWFRVRVGHFPEKSQAKEMERKLKRESYSPIVVRRK
jgi:cell division septation protein DedD